MKKFILIIGTLIIIVIGILIVVKNIKDDQIEKEKLITKIQASSKQLEKNITTYNEVRDNLSSYLASFYQEKFQEDYNTIKGLIDQEVTIIQNTKKIATNLNSNCQRRIFMNQEIDTTCATYQEYYEKIVNVSINDKNKFNEMIQLYNQTEETLKEYSSKYLENYLDYNKDGIYLEREEK